MSRHAMVFALLEGTWISEDGLQKYVFSTDADGSKLRAAELWRNETEQMWNGWELCVESAFQTPYFGGEYRLANREDILDLVLRNEAVFIQAGRMFRRDYRVEKGMMVEREIPLPDIDHSAPIVAIRVPELSPAELLLWEYLIAHFSDGL